MLTIIIQNNFLPERKYIIDVLINEFLGIEYELKVHSEKNYTFLLENDKKIIFEDAFFSKFDEDTGYLSEKNLPEKVKFSKNIFSDNIEIAILYGNSKFEILEKEIICGNDIFAGAFFMLTRWEEVAIKERDKHARFPDGISIAEKNGFHYRPIVNEYLEMLWQMLKHAGINCKRKKHKYEAIITHDIDFIKRYDKFSKLIKAIGGDILMRKQPLQVPRTIKNYIKISQGKEKDIYDTFDEIMDISEANNLKSRFYFIPGMLGEEDVRYNITNEFVSHTIKNIKKREHTVGLHGTYNGYNKPEVFSSELQRLKKIEPNITEGRQHYLRFENPKTWQIWNENNLLTDSTLGYSKDGGFRAGVCYEYPVFDIQKRKKLALYERPLIAMEGGIKVAYPNVEDFYNKIIELKNTTKKYNGKFVFLWHNSNFYVPEWIEYKKLYEKILKEISC